MSVCDAFEVRGESISMCVSQYQGAKSELTFTHLPLDLLYFPFLIRIVMECQLRLGKQNAKVNLIRKTCNTISLKSS